MILYETLKFTPIHFLLFHIYQINQEEQWFHEWAWKGGMNIPAQVKMLVRFPHMAVGIRLVFVFVVWQARNPLPSKWVSSVRLVQIEAVCFEKHLSMDICPEDPRVWSLSPINWTVWLHLGLKVARCVLDQAGCSCPMPLVQMFPLYGDATVWSFNTCWYLERRAGMKIFAAADVLPEDMDRNRQIMCWLLN